MKKNVLLWITGQIKNRIPGIVLMTVAQVAHALFCVFFALGTRGVIDSAVSRDSALFLTACLKQSGIIAGIMISLTVMRHLREKLRADLERDWRKQLLHKLLNGDFAAVSAFHSAELLNRLNNDTTKINDGVLNILPGAASMAVQLIAAVTVLGTLDADFVLVIATIGAVVILLTAAMRRRLKDLNKRVSESDGIVSGFIQEMMEKLLIVQAMDLANEAENRCDVLLEQRYALQRKRKNISLLTNTGVALMYYGAGFIALCWCAARMLRGEMTFGSLAAVTQLVSQLQSPFVNLSGVIPQYVAMVASAERLMELDEIDIAAEPTLEDPWETYKNMNMICGEGLNFSYDRDQVLSDADFELPKGVFAVVTGPSGIGKSTILKLLLGIFCPNGGKLYLKAGAGEMELNRNTRRMFAYVPQGNLLFSGTLRENLTIAKPHASEQELERVIHISAMEEFLQQLPQGLDTMLGESGIGLSEGQAQRLAIARAILSGAPVLLLDECTSALDEHTEDTVLRRIRALKDRTAIVVTHRPAAVNLCNWRLEISDGKISSGPIGDA